MKNHFAIQKAFIAVASSVFVYTKTILRCKMLVGKSQTLELHPMDAGYAFFAKRSFSTPQECAAITEL
ncbi:hypothetical protein HMPREF9436_00513 [Faecalibacterium cf. prausnitzii KLE1255]|uniref:Uncharacterized protein n=1 Tax=Faecalibacterium cf. prausnitzii KLE1255 TaxID=748224 RepID=E2ZFT0_9FIRM|nr:hypothetical protein HMPREF9436_00513 [Faecalibacterium cf. prausnitzii KLE1255]